MSTSRNKMLLIVGLAISVFWPLAAPAQEAQPAARPDSSQGLQQEQEEATQVDDNAIKLFLDKIEVVGRLEKPQAVFIIPGKNPEIDDIRIERSFFNDIFRPVEKKSRTVTKKEKSEPTQNRQDYIPW
jgi:hypothetical protein